MTIPLPEYLGLVVWATAASWLAADRIWLCRRRHRGISADFIGWDEHPATATETAEAGHETARAAS